MIRIVGIDVAVQHKNIGIVVANLEAISLVVEKPMEVGEGYVQSLAELIDLKVPTLLALDAPLGWPAALSVALSSHQAGESIDHKSNDLFRRETDDYVYEKYKKRPLDVGADRIARTAHRALQILDSLRKELKQSIPLAWSAEIKDGVWAIEVYPAATLLAHSIKSGGYKNKKKPHDMMTVRKEIITKLKQSMKLKEEDDCYLTSDHCLDAVICVLAGKDFLEGQCDPPSSPEVARKEGWIWVRQAK